MKTQTYLSSSEEHGIASLRESDLFIYSVGVSTGGIAEARMAGNGRKVIATTLDSEGAKFAEKQWKEAGLSDQIAIKLEDVSAPLPYADEHFDFIYARLVLHYLPKESLKRALDELWRILKTDGRLFVVVRSTESLEAKDKNSVFDPATGMTTYIYRNNLKNREFGQEAPQIFDSERATIAEGQGASENRKFEVRPTQPKTDSSGCFGISQGRSYSRYFHTQESIQEFLAAARFQIQHVKMYEEQLCVDFHRTILSEQIDMLIEVLATKSA